MRDNDGERELVLGNKQLLTIFFAAALLCGVFFAVGLVVGGNSAKPGTNTPASNTDSTTSTEGKREEPSAASNTPASNGSAPGSAPTDLTSAPADTGGVPSAEPHIRDNPSSSTSAPPTQAPPPVAAATYQPAATTAAASSTGVFISVPEAGASYVQVAAPTRPAADVLVKSLREGGLPAILTSSSKPDLFEVLVGPYRTPLTLAEAKRKLTEKGFGSTMTRKF